MDAESTDLIGFGLHSHLRALERLWLLYRAPHRFREWLERQSAVRQSAQAVMLILHVLPHMTWATCAIAYGQWPVSIRESPPDPYDFNFACGIAVGIVAGILIGFAFGIVAGIDVRIAVRIADGIALGIALGIAYGIAYGIAFGFDAGTAFGIAAGIALGIAFGIASGIASGILGGIAGGIAFEIAGGIAVGIALGIAVGNALGVTFGIAFGISLGIAFGIAVTRFYYLAPHLAFFWPKPHASWYRWHPVAWDQLCSIPFPRFDLLLTNYFELNPVEAEAEIERLISTYPSQRSSALRARCRVVARKSGKVAGLGEFVNLVSHLPRRDQRFRAQVPELEVAEVVLAITDLQDTLVKFPANMPAYRLRQAELVCEAIISFRDRIAEFAEPLASEFRTAAEHWLKLASGQLDDARHAGEREPFSQVFRAGDPVQGEKAEAFIPRQHIIQELAGLILATNGCPGILLYARRRMGKSTCLQNLMGFIPMNIVIVFLNLQDPAKCTSLSLFCEQLTEAIRKKLMIDDFRMPSVFSGRNDLVECSRFLDDANLRIGQSNRKLLIALDEFESLDTKLGQRDEAGRPLIPEDLLALFRTSIQSHRNLIWLFSGSHGIAELKHAKWPSYLISVRTVELDRFTLEETSQLLTDPLAHSQLFKGTPNRPTFPPEFWGTDGLRRLHEAADGWPHLVVLLAETCVNLVNLQNAASVTDELFLDVRRKAIVSGDNVMIQLLKNESEIPGEWDFLLGFRDHDVLPAPENIGIRKSLLRRSLVTLEDNQVRLRVPLMHQWIRERSELLD